MSSNFSGLGPDFFQVFVLTLRLHGMSWGVNTTCFKAPGVSLGGSGVSIGGVRSLREIYMLPLPNARQLQLRDGARRTEHLDAHRSRWKMVATHVFSEETVHSFWSSSVLVFLCTQNTLVVILVFLFKFIFWYILMSLYFTMFFLLYRSRSVLEFSVS